MEHVSTLPCVLQKAPFLKMFLKIVEHIPLPRRFSGSDIALEIKYLSPKLTFHSVSIFRPPASALKYWKPDWGLLCGHVLFLI